MFVPVFSAFTAAVIASVIALIIWAIPPLRRAVGSSWLMAFVAAAISMLLLVSGLLSARFEFRWFPQVIGAGLLSSVVTAAIVLVRLAFLLRRFNAR